MFQLAERLGMTVAQLGRDMSAAELSEWMAMDRLDIAATAPGSPPADPLQLRRQMDDRARAALDKMARKTKGVR